jgi:hypothetical protein
MPIPIGLSFTLLTASLLSGATLTTLTGDPIAPLNACIQQRFQDRNVFGMSRVLPNRAHGIRQFQPENPPEQKALTELRNNGYQVTLFLVGRYALDTPPGAGAMARYGLQGPAFMTAEPQDLPDSAELLVEGRGALAAFSTRDGYDIRKREWVVAMRPLRATNEACVQCHSVGPAMFRDEAHRPKLGDALGVAMYVYRKSR